MVAKTAIHSETLSQTEEIVSLQPSHSCHYERSTVAAGQIEGRRDSTDVYVEVPYGVQVRKTNVPEPVCMPDTFTANVDLRLTGEFRAGLFFCCYYCTVKDAGQHLR